MRSAFCDPKWESIGSERDRMGGADMKRLIWITVAVAVLAACSEVKLTDQSARLLNGFSALRTTPPNPHNPNIFVHESVGSDSKHKYSIVVDQEPIDLPVGYKVDNMVFALPDTRGITFPDVNAIQIKDPVDTFKCVFGSASHKSLSCEYLATKPGLVRYLIKVKVNDEIVITPDPHINNW